MTAVQPPTPALLAIRAEPPELRRASAWLREQAGGLSLPDDQIDRLEICLNEVLANLIEHGGPPVTRRPIELRLEPIIPRDGTGVRLQVSDGGLPFDPLMATDKPLPASLRDASPGGLGLRLVRAYSDGMAYRVLEDRNELSIEMHWAQRS
jgi:anti-sigma regulatory factor (Ser/Thr protein kinase)